jgi:hypothetical protein
MKYSIFSFNVANKFKKKFPMAPMRVLTPGLHKLDPKLSPPSTIAGIFGKRVWAGGKKKVKMF